MDSDVDDVSIGKRLAVVGWRNNAGGLEEGETRNDPSRWRGDEYSTALTDDQSSEFLSPVPLERTQNAKVALFSQGHRHTWKTKTAEPDYQSFDLDTGALDALRPSSQVRETQVSGIWVITETKIETSTIS